MIELTYQIWGQILAYLPKFFVAAVMIIVSYYLARLVQRILQKALRLRAVDAGVSNLSIESAYWGIILLGIVLGLQQFFDVATFLAGLGLLGFAVGFALQDVIKNFAAGILLIMQGPFEVGESIGVGEFEGVVEIISLRSISIRTFDGRLVHIPSSNVLNSPLINHTRSPKRRVQVTASVVYDSDLEQVKQVALQALDGLPGLQAQPAPYLVFSGFMPQTIEFSLYYWVDVKVCNVLVAKDYGVHAIQRSFAQAGIKMSPVLVVPPPSLPVQSG